MYVKVLGKIILFFFFSAPRSYVLHVEEISRHDRFNKL